jgi:hypothetical protein
MTDANTDGARMVTACTSGDEATVRELLRDTSNVVFSSRSAVSTSAGVSPCSAICAVLLPASLGSSPSIKASRGAAEVAKRVADVPDSQSGRSCPG